MSQIIALPKARCILIDQRRASDLTVASVGIEGEQ
jgi:hypothetical protein